MDFAATQLARDLTAKLARYVQWEKPLRTFRGQNMSLVNKGGMSWEELDRAERELTRSLREKYDPRSELFPLFERLCAEYGAGADEARASIREFVAARKTLGALLRSYANGIALKITWPHDGPLLERALAAVAIENCATDYRDTLMTLADVFVAAEEAALDPRAAFASVAEICTDAPTTGGCASLAALLRDFYQSSVLNERRLLGPYGGPT
jgi:hypothetical protein